ncbi:MAG TPA: lipopolysaccharide kinase InaA family protein [Thermoanaerobaculia bacterium]|nr:lipopolysaccharide kinase InaA family protein [Thermoanaerobaculia bacterium]
MLDAAHLVAAVERATDPGQALRTLHWGRNYLYLTRLETAAGPLPVAVKQFTHHGRRRRLERRFKGSKAARSWRVARALVEAGIATPEPVLLIESEDPGGPAFYVCRHLDGVTEARYLLRAMNAGTAAEQFPAADPDAFLVALGRTLRRLHDAGVWHRDVTSGNVLIRWPPPGGAAALPELFLLDLNRARVGRRPTVSERTRDLSRMMIFRPEDQRRFLAAYWGDGELGARAGLYRLYHRSFLVRNDAKRAVRSRLRGAVQWAKDLVLPRGTHAHIPAAPEGAATRERVVWDPLSDQPHLHAGKLEKLGTRLADAPSHLGQLAAAGGALPRVWRRYRQLEAALWREPVPFGVPGVALRPRPEDPEGLLAAVEELGVSHLLLRLHPWQAEHAAEEALARELAGRGYDLAFSLPQNRDLVRDPGRWRAAVEELAERFVPFGRAFQVGQAVNRSKWGVWNPREWVELVGTAAEVLRRHDGVLVLGPAVIDFEPHVTAGLVNLPGAPDLDGLASLLYVDRRGAPENRQGPFDTVGKVTLLQAIAETARHCAPRSWVTELNWPLREGPHSPAGRLVSVDEETQADYLVRYLVPALATGSLERAYWWQLAARGYGLACSEEDGTLRRRPAFRALATLARLLTGATAEGRLPAAEPARLHPFLTAGGERLVVAWSTADDVEIAPPAGTTAITDRDGRTRPLVATRLRLTASPLYLHLQS